MRTQMLLSLTHVTHVCSEPAICGKEGEGGGYLAYWESVCVWAPGGLPTFILGESFSAEQ
jgi:hypothetical protein